MFRVDAGKQDSGQRTAHPDPAEKVSSPAHGRTTAMTEQPSPCYRHRRTLWIVGCAECTEYHLAAAIARRDQELAVSRRSHAVSA
jgi:hypothetical protein